MNSSRTIDVAAGRTPADLLLRGVRVVNVFSGEILRANVAVVGGAVAGVGLGLVRGFGPLKGALASTVAHDSHNLILVGGSAEEMEQAARAAAEGGGGLAVVSEGEVLSRLSLPVAGLMSDREVGEVVQGHRQLLKAARLIGCTLEDPFMSMSFLALPVVPELKITDRRLVDVRAFRLVGLWEEEEG